MKEKIAVGLKWASPSELRGSRRFAILRKGRRNRITIRLCIVRSSPLLLSLFPFSRVFPRTESQLRRLAAADGEK